VRLVERELAHHAVGLGMPRQRCGAGGKVLRARQEEERRQQCRSGDLARVDELGHPLNDDRHLLADVRVDICDRAVRRAEVDADDVA